MPILIINQDIVFLEELRFAFELQGYQVITTRHSLKAIQLFFQHKPRVVILRVEMPHKDGFEIIREIRAFCQKTFVLAVSANQIYLRAIRKLGANAAFLNSTEASIIVSAVKFL
jgi:DNA-binding response OmpR family regulator